MVTSSKTVSPNAQRMDAFSNSVDQRINSINQRISNINNIKEDIKNPKQTIRSGEGVYAELGDDGKLKDTVYVKRNDQYVPTVTTMGEVRFVDVVDGKAVPKSGSSYSSRSRSRSFVNPPSSSIPTTPTTPQVAEQISKPTTVSGVDTRADQRVNRAVTFSPETSSFVSESSYAKATRNPLSEREIYDQANAVRRGQMKSYFETEYKDLSPKEILARTEIKGGMEMGVTATFQPAKSYSVMTNDKDDVRLNWTEKSVYEGVKLREGYGELSKSEFKEGYKDTPLGKISLFGSEFKQTGRDVPEEFKLIFESKGVNFDRPLTRSAFELGKGLSFVTGEVVGSTLEDPVKDLATYTFGFGVGKGVKYASPIVKGLSVDIAQTGSLGRSFVKGTKVGVTALGVGYTGVAVGSKLLFSDDRATEIVKLGKEFALFGAGYSSGVAGGQPYAYSDVKAFVKGKKGDVGFDWKIEQPALALTNREAIFQRGGVQTSIKGELLSDLNVRLADNKNIDFVNLYKMSDNPVQKTLFGEVISPKDVYSVRASKGLFPDKSVSGVPIDFYKQIAISKGKDTTQLLKLDVKYKVKSVDKVLDLSNDKFVRQDNFRVVYDELLNVKSVRSSSGVFLNDRVPLAKFGVTESGETVITSMGGIGSQTKGFIDQRARLLDIKTGKEYDVPLQFVERRLIENPNLEVVGRNPRQLFATEPIGALIQTGRDIFYKPSSIIKGVESGTPILRVKTESPSKNFVGFTPSVFASRGRESVVEQEFAQREKQGLKVFVSPMLSLKNELSLSTDNISVADVKEKNDYVSTVFTGLRSGSKSRSRLDLDIGSKLVTETVPVVTTITQPVNDSVFDFPKPPRTSAKFSDKAIEELKIPSTPSISMFSFSRNKFSGGNDPVSLLVRERGAFVEKGLFSGVSEALSAGKRIVGGSSSASFKIVGSGGVFSPAGQLGDRFAFSKRDRGVIVEKSKFRISSPGELREITFKGVRASSVKRRVKNKKNNNFWGGFNL